MKVRGPASISVALHALLVVLAVVHIGWTSPTVRWGNDGNGGATTMTLTAGIPLPPSPVQNPLATPTETLNLPEKATKPEKTLAPPATSKTFDVVDRNKQQREREEHRRKNMLAELKNMPTQAANAIRGSGAAAGSETH